MPAQNPFGRVLTAMVTPMTPDGAIDEAGVRAVARHLVDTGHDGIVVNGTTGESATLTSAESIEAVRLVADEVGDRAAVIAGVGSNNTAHSIAMLQAAADAGATGLLVVSPYYNKPTQPGLIAHCHAIADATELPIMLYDIPGRTATPFATDTLIELAKHPRIRAVKDAKGDLAASVRVMRETDYLWYSGEDALNLPLLALGATGVVSVVGHVCGREHAELVAAVDAGDLARAREIQNRLVPAVDAIMTTSQGAIMAKAAMVELGVIEHPTVRLPLVEGPPEHLEILRRGLAASGLTGGAA
ncbi:4-hydroxy-tetrahydrodipicolinate synthase [Marihabitans asiaticum]|uniref:4-hydroxy-tetrahydrodipicolinate synthase n=1 Tax=Marihabitans asiaticum TaxID=415218 RepID=A0A560W7S1_9MICO|nr:4-hydroxy-tetrahydrodipicolinate synthase [Marihabitans asiaticum]TWD13687.1 4-hydroxy-tetrahydrodipicolinate synthase [Marihabitans asiaticum]